MIDDFSHKSVLKSQYAKDPERFVVIANVLVPALSTRWHELSKDGWNVIPTSGGTEYYREFVVTTSTPKEWIASIDSLNRLLLAYFISDFVPRKIHSFELPQHIIKKLPNLFFVFGSDQSKSFNEYKYQLSSDMDGWIFNGFISDDPHYQTDIPLIDEWYEILKNNRLFTCVNLLKEALIIQSKTDLSKGIKIIDDIKI